MISLNCNVLSADDDVSQTGPKVDSGQLFSASFQTIFGDTTAAGTVSIQMSNDPLPVFYQASAFTPENWSNIPDATSTVTAGVCAPIVIPHMCFRWIRVVFTSSVAGTSTISVNMNALSP